MVDAERRIVIKKSCGKDCTCRVAPNGQRFGSCMTPFTCRLLIPAMMKQVGGRIVDGEKSLNMPRCFEAFHDALPSSGRLMRVFGAVVETLVLSMLGATP